MCPKEGDTLPEISEARKRANKKWNEANQKERYDRIQLVAQKGQKEIIADRAKREGQSLNQYILEAVSRRMESEANEHDSVATPEDLEAIAEARAEYAQGESVPSSTIDWDN